MNYVLNFIFFNLSTLGWAKIKMRDDVVDFLENQIDENGNNLFVLENEDDLKIAKYLNGTCPK